MNSVPWSIASAIAVLLCSVCSPTFGAGAELPGNSNERDVRALSLLIDRELAAHWQDRVEPAVPADDFEFARRVYLDLAGRVPPVSALRAFLDDTSADKRQRLVERLLDSPQYAAHLAVVWRGLMLPESETNDQIRFQGMEFGTWLQRRLRENAGYDQIVRELLTAGEAQSPRNRGEMPPGPAAFYEAKEHKPENLAAATSRLFLGVRLDCAQCHNHPFTAWKQADFWAFAAFFDRIPSNADQTLAARLRASFGDPGEIAIKMSETGEMVPGRFLGSDAPVRGSQRSPLSLLANWMVAAENPYFARTAVNRLWTHFFATGIVEPVDDFDASNAPSHPDLLDELAHQFVGHAYDVKFLIRAITGSRAYQLSSKFSHPEQSDRRLFARIAARPLSPEQLLNSLAQITSFTNGNASALLELNQAAGADELQELFAAGSEGATERQMSVLQALSLMNGPLVANATNPLQGRLIASIAEFPGMNSTERIETLYLATLSRPPRAEELTRLTEFVREGGPEGSERFALCDILWSLVNSSEFLSNH